MCAVTPRVPVAKNAPVKTKRIIRNIFDHKKWVYNTMPYYRHAHSSKNHSDWSVSRDEQGRAVDEERSIVDVYQERRTCVTCWSEEATHKAQSVISHSCNSVRCLASFLHVDSHSGPVHSLGLQVRDSVRVVFLYPAVTNVSFLVPLQFPSMEDMHSATHVTSPQPVIRTHSTDSSNEPSFSLGYLDGPGPSDRAPYPLLFHGPRLVMANALVYLRDTGFADGLESTMRSLGVRSSVVRTPEFVSPVICIHDAALRDVYMHIAARDIPDGSATVRYVTVGDRVRLVGHLIHSSATDENNDSALSPSRPSWPATAFLMVEVNPPQVVHPLRKAMAIGTDELTYTSGSLHGWYLATSPLLDWLRSGHRRVSDMLTIQSGVASDATLFRSIERMRAWCLDTPSALDKYFKVIALCALSTAFSVYGIDSTEHIAWFDLLIAHVHSIVSSDAFPISSTDGSKRTALPWINERDFTVRSALHIVHHAKAFDDMSRRIWEVALVLVHLLSPSHAAQSATEVAEVVRICKAPFVGPLLCLLPGVVGDVQRFAPLVCQHYKGALGSSSAHALVMPTVLTNSSALQWLLVSQHWSGAAALAHLEAERGRRNRRPVVCMRFRDVVPSVFRDVLRGDDQCDVDTALVFGLNHERDDVLDTLLIATPSTLAFVSACVTLRAMCSPYQTTGPHMWTSQHAMIGSVTRSVVGLLLWGNMTAHHARRVAAGLATLVMGPPRSDTSIQMRVKPLGWLARVMASASSRGSKDYTHLVGINFTTRLVRTAMCGEPRIVVNGSRMRGLLLLVRDVLSHEKREQLCVEGGYRFEDVKRLLESMSGARVRGHTVELSRDHGQLLATLILVSPSINVDALNGLCSEIEWPAPMQFSADRLRPMDSSARFDANARRRVPHGDAIAIRDALPVMDAFGTSPDQLATCCVEPVQWMTALVALLHWMEAEVRNSRDLTWASCWNAADVMIREGMWPAFAVLMHEPERQLGYEAWPDRDCIAPVSVRDSAIVSDWMIEALDSTRAWTWNPSTADVHALPPLSLVASEPDESEGVMSEVARDLSLYALHWPHRQRLAPILSNRSPRAADMSLRFRLFSGIDGMPIAPLGEAGSQLLPSTKKARRVARGNVGSPARLASPSLKAPVDPIEHMFEFQSVDPCYSPSRDVEAYDPENAWCVTARTPLEGQPRPVGEGNTASQSGAATGTSDLISSSSLDALLEAVSNYSRAGNSFPPARPVSPTPTRVHPSQAQDAPVSGSASGTGVDAQGLSAVDRETMRSRIADAVQNLAGGSIGTDVYLAAQTVPDERINHFARIWTSREAEHANERDALLRNLLDMARTDVYGDVDLQ